MPESRQLAKHQARPVPLLPSRRRASHLIALPILLLALLLTTPINLAPPAHAQSSPAPRMEFEVASIRQNTSADKPYSNFPLGPQSQYNDTSGKLLATNRQLLEYIIFAWVKTISQIQALRAQLPDWARAAHYDIEAQAPGHPTKDDMREMMKSLLEDRFQVKVHHELRQVPVFALVLTHPGKTGPNLQPHPADDPECLKHPLPQAVPGGYGAACGSGTQVPSSGPGLYAIAGHKISIAMIAVGLGGADTEINRPVVDRTGLTGTFDYSLEWAPANLGNAAESASDANGLSFQQALKDQLGLKLVPQMGQVDFVVLDHLERPSDN